MRHAQTHWNDQNRLQGHSDIQLSPVGHRQAQCLGRWFAGSGADHRPLRGLYTSHLARSLQTAKAIGARTGLVPVVEPALAETSLGAWEGLTPEQVDAHFGGAYRRWRASERAVEIPGAERPRPFKQRIRGAFSRIAAAHPADEGVIIVTHGGAIAAWLAEWLDVDYHQLLRGLPLDNAGISAVDCSYRPPRVLWVNHLEHLAPQAAQDRAGQGLRPRVVRGRSSRGR